MALGDRKLLADRVAEVENVDQFFNEAYECFEHGIAPWGWGDWEGGRVSTGLPAWMSRRSTPHAEASGELVDGPAVAARLRTSARRRFTIIEAGRV